MEQTSSLENVGQVRRRNGIAGPAILLPLLLAAIVLTSFFIHTNRIRTTEQRLCQSIGVAASRDVEKSLAFLVAEGQTLSDALSKNGALSKEQVGNISQHILQVAPFVAGVSTAPNAIIKYHFPEDESVVGHDLLSNPDRSYALTLAAQTRAPVISGPYESVDNSGRIFFVRYPVYVAGTLWGFTSLTVDYEKWYKSLDLDAAFPGVLFGISRKQDDFSGSSDIKAALSNALVKEIPVQGGSVWQLLVIPQGGWSAFDPLSLILLVAGLLASLLLFLILSENGRRQGANLKAPATPMDGTSLDRIEEIVQLVGQVAITPAKEHDGHAPSDSASSHGSKLQEPGVDQNTAGRDLVSDSPEVTEFKGPDIRGEVFMPEAPVENNFASQLKKKTEPTLVVKPLEAAKIEHPEADATRDAQPKAEAESKASPVSSVPPEPASELQTPQEAPREPRIALDKPQERVTKQEITKQETLFPMDEEVERQTSLPKSSRGRRVKERERIQQVQPAQKQLPILVVDDSEANRDIMDHMIRSFGYDLDLATSGDQACELCTTNSYQLIFMDCFMPGQDGYKTTQKIRSESLSAQAKIIGMSARLGDLELQRCLDAGMDDLLAKPFTLKEVGAMIQKHTQGHADPSVHET
ncbi:MAG TPA: response regulator [Spirochaetales bacterium]|nr:response regulator [Spirochaetales bacterium]